MIVRYDLYRMEYVMKCDVDGKLFRAKRAHAKTCSPKCRQKLHRNVTLLWPEKRDKP